MFGSGCSWCTCPGLAGGSDGQACTIVEFPASGSAHVLESLARSSDRQVFWLITTLASWRADGGPLLAPHFSSAYLQVIFHCFNSYKLALVGSAPCYAVSQPPC
eukprot:363781-Chlamydomonas_euryale.AAC.27